VWESQDDWDKFAESRLGPAFATVAGRMGIDLSQAGEPETQVLEVLKHHPRRVTPGVPTRIASRPPGGCDTVGMDGSFELHLQRRGLFSSERRGLRHRPARVTPNLSTSCSGRSAASGRGTAVVEVGPGTGQATARLLDLGASVTASS